MSHPSDAIAARFDDRSLDVRIPTSRFQLPRIRTLIAAFVVSPFLLLFGYILLAQVAMVIGLDPFFFLPKFPFALGSVMLMQVVFFGLAWFRSHATKLAISTDTLSVTRHGSRSTTKRIPTSSVRAAHRTGDQLRIVTEDDDLFINTTLIPDASTDWLVEQIEHLVERAHALDGEPDPELVRLRAAQASKAKQTQG